MLAAETSPFELFPITANALEDNITSAPERLSAGDAVNLPAHYARFKIEPIRFMVENFGPGIFVGKVIKYSMRYDAKNGMEDLRKAKRCLEMLIKFVDGDEDWWKREVRKEPESIEMSAGRESTCIHEEMRKAAPSATISQ